MTDEDLLTECAMTVKPEDFGRRACFYNGSYVLRGQYNRRRAELINEPGDENAADTPAKYVTQDANGEWWWHDTMPYIVEEHAVWDSDGWQTWATRGKVPAGHDWRNTLREVTPMTTTPNAPTWPQHPAHKAQDHELNPTSSSLPNSQAREFAEESGTCSDGTPCGELRVYGSRYCAQCPNMPEVPTHQQMIDRCNYTLAFWPADINEAQDKLPTPWPWEWFYRLSKGVFLANNETNKEITRNDWCAGIDLSSPRCLHYGGECGKIGYCVPCPNRPQPGYNPEDVVFTSDPINPNHYRAGKVECIDALESATINKRGIEAICTANAIKYLWRYESKGGLEYVRKARWYLELLENHLSD